MAHSNSFPTIITVSQQINQAHFQQTIQSQLESTVVGNNQIIFPQCQQSLSIQHAQNSSMAAVSNVGVNGKAHMQLSRPFINHGQTQQPQLTIPVQLAGNNNAFTTSGIPLDLSYLMQGGCLPHCVPIQLTGSNGLQPSFQAALSCVSAPSPSQTEQGVNNSFLQFANVSLSYPQCLPQISQPCQTQVDPTPAPQKMLVKRRKKPIAKIIKTNIDRFQSVGVQTDFDMSLCRQQIVVVPPKNCTCGAVAKAVASGAFQAASFPPRKNDKRAKLSSVDIDHDEHEHHQPNATNEDCNGAVVQTSCDNRGRPFTYECLYCPKKFSLHSRLVAHLRCHTGMRPFSCLQCGYSFTQRSYLNRHAAVHKQERPFSCLSCHKTYKHYGSLANHRKLHTKEHSEKSATLSEPAATPVAPTHAHTVTAPPTQFQISSSSVLPQHFTAMSSSSDNTAQVYPLSSGPATQIFPGSQTLAAFYPGQDGQGFLLSLNPSSMGSTIANNTMMLHLRPQYSTSTLPSRGDNAYVPIMSSPAFS